MQGIDRKDGVVLVTDRRPLQDVELSERERNHYLGRESFADVALDVAVETISKRDAVDIALDLTLADIALAEGRLTTRDYVAKCGEYHSELATYLVNV